MTRNVYGYMTGQYSIIGGQYLPHRRLHGECCGDSNFRGEL